MSTDVDRVNYRTITRNLPVNIASGQEGIRFLRIIEFEYPASPLGIVQYERNGEEQEYGLRLDMDKFAFLDHYGADMEVERRAAKQIVSYLAKPLAAAAAAGFGD